MSCAHTCMPGPLQGDLQGWEGRGPVAEDGAHVRQRGYGCPLHNIYDHQPFQVGHLLQSTHPRCVKQSLLHLTGWQLMTAQGSPAEHALTPCQAKSLASDKSWPTLPEQGSLETCEA